MLRTFFYIHYFAETTIDKTAAPATTNIKLYIYTILYYPTVSHDVVLLPLSVGLHPSDFRLFPPSFVKDSAIVSFSSFNQGRGLTV
jgi:hypothetical protein